MIVYEVYQFDGSNCHRLKLFMSFEEARDYLFNQKDSISFSYGMRQIVV